MRLERLAKSRHVLLERGLRISGGPLAPELVDQPIARHGLAGVEKEDREDASLSRTAERELPLAVTHLERAENAEVERARQIANVPRSRCQSTDSALKAPRKRRLRTIERVIRPKEERDEVYSCVAIAVVAMRRTQGAAESSETVDPAALDGHLQVRAHRGRTCVENGIRRTSAGRASPERTRRRSDDGAFDGLAGRRPRGRVGSLLAAAYEEGDDVVVTFKWIDGLLRRLGDDARGRR